MAWLELAGEDSFSVWGSRAGARLTEILKAMDVAIRKVCIIRSGTMGSGIAQVSAQAGYGAALVDIKQEFPGQSRPRLKNFSPLFGQG